MTRRAQSRITLATYHAYTQNKQSNHIHAEEAPILPSLEGIHHPPYSDTTLTVLLASMPCPYCKPAAVPVTEVSCSCHVPAPLVLVCACTPDFEQLASCREMGKILTPLSHLAVAVV